MLKKLNPVLCVIIIISTLVTPAFAATTVAYWNVSATIQPLNTMNYKSSSSTGVSVTRGVTYQFRVQLDGKKDVSIGYKIGDSNTKHELYSGDSKSYITVSFKASSTAKYTFYVTNNSSTDTVTVRFAELTK